MTSTSIKAQTDNNPYIYYFSHRLQAFVIERANGTDSRVLGNGLMKNVNQVSGAGWSPSGKWFAWHAEQIGAYGNTENERAFIVTSNGTNRLSLLDGIKQPQLYWSPKADILLVASQNIERASNSTITYRRVIAVVDPSKNSIVKIKDQRLVDTVGSFIYAKWIDNQSAIIEYIDEDSSQYKFLIIKTNGDFIEKSFENLVPETRYHSPSFSSVGNIAYTNNETLVIENLVTGQQSTYNLPRKVSDLSIHWSPNGEYGALLRISSIVSLSKKRLQKLSVSPYISDSLRVDSTQLFWSPNNRHALFTSVTSNTFYRLYHLSLDNLELEELPEFTVNKIRTVGWSWTSQGQSLVYKAVQAMGTQMNVSASYVDFDDPSNNTVIGDLPPVGGLYTGWPSISHDNRYISYFNDGPIIYDRQNGKINSLRPAGASYNSMPNGEIMWQPHGEWMFTFDGGLVAGGGDCCRHVGILRADGTHQRDLTYIVAQQPISINWLPPQVTPDMLPKPLEKSVHEQPEKVLKGNDWTFELIWSPDSKKIATGGGGGWGNPKIDVWDIVTGNSETVFETASDDQIASWQQNGVGTYMLELVKRERLNAWDGVNGITLAISPDKLQAVIYSDVPEVVTISTRKRLRIIGDIYSQPTYASYSPDGKFLAIGSPYQDVQIWNTQTWKMITLPHHATAVGFSPDGKFLAANNSWDIYLWKVDMLLNP